jgi:DNA-directed RNA polymerase specialized sigma24 family protein
MGSLRSTFMNLPKRERLALTLHQIEGFDTNAIAEVLGISGGEARGALARGYSRIQQSWKSGRGPGA